MKKTIIAVLSVCMAAFTLAACQTTPDPSTPPLSPSTGSESTDTGSTDSTSTGNGTQDPQLPDEDPSLAVLESAYALQSGAFLSGTHTLTGVITDIEKTGQGDVCLTFVVGNYTQYPMYCYWLQDADYVQVGDTITVSGQIKNHSGLIEFDHPTLVDHQSGTTGGNTGAGSNYTYTDFTTTEKALFREYFGEVIPFAPNNEYTVEEYEQYYEDDNQTERGINFYTFGNTQTDFNAYLATFSAYESDGTGKDEDGDTWYYFNGDGYYVDVCYWYDSDEKGYWLDVYAYLLTTGDNTGGSTGGSTGGNTGGSSTPSNVMTNAGKGLPTGTDGVYNVDFTKATYVKNVHDQGYYLGGCPTLSTANSNPAVLVVPVQFSDVTAASKGYTTDNIRKIWTGSTGTTDYYSVRDYYYQSSYGQLDLDITVLDEWFTPENPSTYYLNAKIDYYGEKIDGGDQLIIDEILAYYESRMDLSKFDSDGNHMIDAIVLINTLDINSDKNASVMQWAYRYWNVYTDDQGYYYEYDGVSANDYLWAPYSFMHESYDASDNVSYDDTSVLNPYTFIHEFGHVLGADDYYDTSYSTEDDPMAGCDVMDGMTGDHNAYTKFNYGWLTTSRLVVAESSVTLTLEDFSKNGDTIILANNWDEALGIYQEYYILVYYKNVGLNGGDNAGYFARDGVVVYHVNASLCSETEDGETYYDVYNNNTDPSDEYGTQDNLIEYVLSTEGTYTYAAGDSLSANTTDDQGNKIAYTFTVDSLTDNAATITFTKNK